MIFLLLLFHIAAFVIEFFDGTAYYFADIVVYTAIFVIPTLFLRASIKRFGLALDWKCGSRDLDPAVAIFVAFTGVAAVLAMGYITNTYFFVYEYFGVELFENEAVIESSETVLQSILYAISAAVIPAIVEEILFRGTVLKLLLPYGKTLAVFISALLFAFMHGTVEQILFSFVFGLLLGYVTIRTSSILYAVFAHFMNNFISTVMEYIFAYLPEDFAYGFSLAVDVFVVILGIIGLVMLIMSMPSSSNRPDAEVSGGYSISAVLKTPVAVIYLILGIAEIAVNLVYMFI